MGVGALASGSEIGMAVVAPASGIAGEAAVRSASGRVTGTSPVLVACGGKADGFGMALGTTSDGAGSDVIVPTPVCPALLASVVTGAAAAEVPFGGGGLPSLGTGMDSDSDENRRSAREICFEEPISADSENKILMYGPTMAVFGPMARSQPDLRYHRPELAGCGQNAACTLKMCTAFFPEPK